MIGVFDSILPWSESGCFFKGSLEASFTVEAVMYMMLDDVTFTVKTTGATGTYNLYSYYEYAKTLNNANLTAVVEALMKYSVSANNYRTSVVNK